MRLLMGIRSEDTLTSECCNKTEVIFVLNAGIIIGIKKLVYFYAVGYISFVR